MNFKRIKQIITYLLLSILLLGCSVKSITATTKNKNDIKEYDYIIKINIDAPKEKVWSIITDFKNYSKWNTVLKMENNVHLELGKKFDVTIFKDDGSIADSFQAIAVSKNKYKSFSASQTILSKSFFKATHYFVIEEISKEKVIFI